MLKAKCNVAHGVDAGYPTAGEQRKFLNFGTRKLPKVWFKDPATEFDVLLVTHDVLIVASWVLAQSSAKIETHHQEVSGAEADAQLTVSTLQRRACALLARKPFASRAVDLQWPLLCKYSVVHVHSWSLRAYRFRGVPERIGFHDAVCTKAAPLTPFPLH